MCKMDQRENGIREKIKQLGKFDTIRIFQLWELLSNIDLYIKLIVVIQAAHHIDVIQIVQTEWIIEYSKYRIRYQWHKVLFLVIKNPEYFLLHLIKGAAKLMTVVHLNERQNQDQNFFQLK